MATRQPQGSQPSPKRRRGVVFMVIGGCLGFLALVGLTFSLNGIAYLMGGGTEVRVTVTESSFDTEEGGHDGAGYYTEDGERVTVRLSYVEEGETVTARLPVIPMPAIGNPVITNSTDAWESVWMITGVALIGGFGAVFVRRGRGYYTGRIQPVRHRLSWPIRGR